MMELRRSCKFVLPKEMSPFFLGIGETISKRMMPANFVYGTNIKTQNLQLKARPKQNIRNERWGYIIKIYLKDIVVVPVQIK